MRLSLLLRSLFVLSVLLARDCAAARTGDVTVREAHSGVPCFSISEAEEYRSGAPNFHAITVQEAGPGARAVMWVMAMPRERTFPVSFRMCVPYAGRLPVLPQTPAAALQAGRIYEVSIEARAPFAANAPRSYKARFCIARGTQGAARVRLVGADPKARYACGA